MKIALLGYGKMNRLVERQALERNDEILIKSSRPSFLSDQIETLKQADVCIDFSHSSCVLSHVRICAAYGLNLVIGTTGWEHDLEEVKRLILQSSIGCLYGSNFSIGMAIFTRIVQEATQFIEPFDEYDLGAFELHHCEKFDQPSGTAKELTKRIRDRASRFSDLNFSSVRCGHMPGTHTLYFDSPVDTITLSHQARNRNGFVIGALQSAQWLIGKKGLFTLDDLLDSSIEGNTHSR